MSNFFVRQAVATKNDLKRSAGALLGIIQGMLCDGHLSDEEIRFLKTWIERNELVATTWPGDVLHARIKSVLEDGDITQDERDYLVNTLQQLIGGESEELADATHVTELALDRSTVVCIPDAVFCLTGEFVYAARHQCEEVIVKLGGQISNSITKKVGYLVVGGLGSPEWKNGSYGTKIQKAIDYKRKGVPLFIVHEDQWAAAAFA